MSTALLIIDVQQALCSGEYACFEAQRVIAALNDFAHRVRAAGQTVVVIQHESRDGPLQRGSAGWQLAPGLAVAPSDVLLRKRTPDAFHETELVEVLRSRAATKLIIGGLQSEFCVDTTTRRALALGYPVQLVADGYSTTDSPVLSAAQITAHHNETLAGITSFGVRVRALAAAQIEVEV